MIDALSIKKMIWMANKSDFISKFAENKRSNMIRNKMSQKELEKTGKLLRQKNVVKWKKREGGAEQ